MKTSDAYNLWANSYDDCENKTRDLDKYVTETILSRLTFDKVLEIGCGTGKNTVFIATKAKQIVAVDFSFKMLEVAKVKLSSHSNITFSQADITKEWKFSTLSFDLIVCNLVLEHIAELNFVFQQAANKLGSNGVFFICELHPLKHKIGSSARFEVDDDIVMLESTRHSIENYKETAEANGFTLETMNEWKDNGDAELPRLLSFVFKKV